MLVKHRNVNGGIITILVVFLFAVLCSIFFTKTYDYVSADDWTAMTSPITSGDGSASNPYVIDSADKLAYMAVQCNNNSGNYRSAYYKQTTDIDLSSRTWTIISDFSGYYDGQGYTINGLNCDSSLTTFALINNFSGTWKNTGFTNVNIDTEGQRDNYHIATLAVNASSTSLIEGCFVTGTIYVKPDRRIGMQTYSIYVGGLVDDSAGTITNCYSAATISGVQPYVGATGATQAGGIARIISGGTISKCYSISTMYVYGGYWKVGGVVGYPNNGTIIDSVVLTGTCKQASNSRNNFTNYQYTNSADATITNCSVLSESDLKNNTNTVLSTWEWNVVNVFPRTWGFVEDSSSTYYNSGYPQLRVFYENFVVNFYSEDGSQLLGTKTTRYPEYRVDFTNISVPIKRGYTYNNQFSSEMNSQGTKYTNERTNIAINMNLYAAYDINYYNLKITTSNTLAGTMTLREERVAYNTEIIASISSVNAGYRFLEWRNANDNSLVSTSENYVFNMPDNDVSIYSYFMQETYSLKIVINNTEYGSASGASDFYTVGQTASIVATPAKGYKVDKIYLEDGTVLTQNETYSYTMPRNNVKIYIDFVLKELNLTIVSYPNGTATTIGSGTYYKGDTVNISFSGVLSGYTFACWKVNDVNKETADYIDENVAFVMPDEDTTIYCYFLSNDKSYVAFIARNGKVISDEEIVLGGSATIPAESSYQEENWTFKGWFTAASGGTQITSFDNIQSNRLVVYAQYDRQFNCNVELITNFINTNEYQTNANSGLFLALKSVNNKILTSVSYNSQTSYIKLPESGTYTFTYAIPTYYTVEIYVNGGLISTNNFDVDLYDENIVLEFKITNKNDYLLYNSNESLTGSNLAHSISPIQIVNGQEVYFGVNAVVNKQDFSLLDSAEIPVSPYGYKMKDVIGAINWGGKYNFTTLNYLSEGANFVGKDMGSTTYKISLASNYADMYPYNGNWGTNSINNMTELASSPAYQDLFNMPEIETFIMVAYEFSYCPWERVITNGYTLSDMEIYYEFVRQEFAELTRYLLDTYQDSGKVFILSNWEGDNAYGAYFDLCTTDEERQLLTDAYVGYINARQDGIINGRAQATSSSNSKVYGNFEVCHVRSDIPSVPNRWRLVDVAIPYTYCDLYSISDWYTYLKDENGNYTFPITEILDDIYNAAQNNMCYKDPSNYPLNPDFVGKKNVMVTEFGYDENNDAEFNAKIRHEMKEAIEWGVYKIVYWEVYSNVVLTQNHERPRNEDMQGLWLIRPDGTFTEAFWYMKSLIDGLDYVANVPKIVFDVTNNEGLDWELYKDKIIFEDDLVDGSKMKDSSVTNLQDGTNNLLMFYSIDTASANYDYFKNYNKYEDRVDLTGLMQSNNGDEIKYITYEMYSNRFAVLLYNYNDINNYLDINNNVIDNLIIFEGKTIDGTWESIDNIKIEQQYDETRTDNFWYQTYISCEAQVGRYSELRISFANKGYNPWDPILTSVMFFSGGEVWKLKNY